MIYGVKIMTYGISGKRLNINYGGLHFGLLFDSTEDARKYKEDNHTLRETLDLFEQQYKLTSLRERLYREFKAVADEDGIYPMYDWLKLHSTLPVLCTVITPNDCPQCYFDKFEIAKKRYRHRRNFIVLAKTEISMYW